MFCSKCGAQLPEDANFCLKCGKPQRASAGVTKDAAPSVRHWEYREFRESLKAYTNGKKFICNCASLAGGDTPLPDSGGRMKMNVLIDNAVRALLKRISPDGWEPIEPIQPEYLWQSLRVKFVKRGTYNILFANQYSWELIEVCLNCRRWISGTTA